ncbi:uncharacterized protein N0V89_001060 [Didymosphaeria variabile]|uniref:Transcription factor domain-containing protein n=1 Tax=Didymosphaeria variabile TaxID=1932322 RepID=A0A9W8XXQ0_9PLEO|nr:uncharacterized protein N0V89_001060 [Didymosphaeria variabile]KAJ4360495.1 hypothetical protein N0V89_001060 [Didymosphaeria variabile]
MSGYYPPNANIPPQYYNVNPNVLPNSNLQNVPPVMAADGSYAHGVPESPVYHTMPGAFAPYVESHMQQPYLGQYQEVPGGMDASQDANARTRRRPGPGEHSNQKTGRSGSKSGKSSSADSGEGSSPEDHNDDAKERLPPIVDDDEEEYEDDMEVEEKGQGRREASDTPALTLDRSPSPSTETFLKTPSMTSSRPPIHRKSSHPTAKSAAAMKPAQRKDIQFYLDYFKNHMSAHHYSLKHDTSKFFKTDYLEHAMRYPPLLFAIVGYAAYFHTLNQPNARMHTFLQYYDESISRLRANMMKTKKQGLSTLLTILQLAAIEEVLGDWVNLMGHQKAANQMLTQLYTPETITESPFLLKVILWYSRFDLFVGLQSGGEAILSRDWYVAVHEHFRMESTEQPDELGLRYDERFAYSRLVAKDSSDFFFKKGKGMISDAEFMEELPKLGERVHALESNIDPMLLDPKHKVHRIPGTPDPDSVVNAFEPDLLWGGSYWTSNYLKLDMWGIMFMYDLSSSLALQKPFDPEVTKRALRSAQLFEAIRNYPDAPPGAMIEAQASFAIATLFLPKDPKTVTWCRKTLAKVESAGYIYSNVLRSRFLGGWGIPQSDWWLPNDEGCPPIIRSIKDFIQERTTAPKDEVSENLREMRGIFGTLTISDSPPDDTSSNATEDTVGLGSVGTNTDDMLYYTGSSPDYEYGFDPKSFGAEPYGLGKFS